LAINKEIPYVSPGLQRKQTDVLSGDFSWRKIGYNYNVESGCLFSFAKSIVIRKVVRIKYDAGFPAPAVKLQERRMPGNTASLQYIPGRDTFCHGQLPFHHPMA